MSTAVEFQLSPESTIIIAIDKIAAVQMDSISQDVSELKISVEGRPGAVVHRASSAVCRRIYESIRVQFKGGTLRV